MALVTSVCVVGAFLPNVIDWFLWALALMVAGEIVTLARRLYGIAAMLKGKP